MAAFKKASKRRCSEWKKVIEYVDEIKGRQASDGTDAYAVMVMEEERARSGLRVAGYARVVYSRKDPAT